MNNDSTTDRTWASPLPATPSVGTSPLVDGPDHPLSPAPTEPFRTPEELLALLLELVGPERTGPAALWVLFLDRDRRMLPAVLPISDLPPSPHPGLVNALVQVMASVIDREAPGGGVAFGLVRAAGGDRGAHEAAWSHALRTAADDADVPVLLVAAVGRDRARVLEW